MMTNYDKITPIGARDRLFLECEFSSKIESKLRKILVKFGYKEVKTPGLEFLDVFSHKNSYYSPETMYKSVDSRGRLLVVRPDSTIPIARLTASKLQGVDLPLRIFYAQRVYRPQAEHSGMASDFMQVGSELIGSSSFESDIEVLQTAISSLLDVQETGYRFEIGHVGIYNKLIERLGASEEQEKRIHSYISSKNYSALVDVLEPFNDETAQILLRLPKLFGGRGAISQATELFSGYDEEIEQILAYLERIMSELEARGLSDRCIVDFGLVGRPEYYTSIVFKGYISGCGDNVLSGGRYDGLFAEFGEDRSAAGWGMNVDLITDTNIKAKDLVLILQSESEEKKRNLRIALTKGRLEKDFLDILEKIGIDVSPILGKGRKLIIELEKYGIELLLAKAPDVITYVEHGACDIGIVGKDTISEAGGKYYEIMDLKFGICKFALAAKKGDNFYEGFGTKRIASKYPKVAANFFENKNMDVEIIKIEGSVELAPLLDLADGIVDIVETGTTLRENGLEIIEDIKQISARLIVNTTSMKLKKDAIENLVARLEQAINN